MRNNVSEPLWTYRIGVYPEPFPRACRCAASICVALIFAAFIIPATYFTPISFGHFMRQGEAHRYFEPLI
jgi:hypothetical protein